MNQPMVNSTAPPGKRRLKRKAKVTMGAYLFLLPAIVLLGIFFYYPMLSAFYYSLCDYGIFTSMEFIGLGNYARLLRDPIFIKAAGNMLLYYIGIVPSLVILPLLLASLVNRKLKGMYFFRLTYYLPYITSMVAVAIVWQFMYHPQGLVNNLLQALGLFKGSEPINWLFNSKTALWAVVVMEVWKAAGYYMLIYLAALQSVPHELKESAYLDGANGFQVFWHVTLPSIRPTMVVAFILASMSALKTFTSVYVMTGGGPLNSTMTLSMYIYNKGFVDMEMGYASAIGIVLWVVLMVLSFMNFKFGFGRDTE